MDELPKPPVLDPEPKPLDAPEPKVVVVEPNPDVAAGVWPNPAVPDDEPKPEDAAVG